MKTQTRLWIVSLLFGMVALDAPAQFSSGSDGSDGALLVDSTTGNVTLTVPEDGIFHFTTITLANLRSLTFDLNANNTPVYLLASGAVSLDGHVNVNGGQGNNTSGGVPGPGGFAGGNPASISTPPGDGHGPGGGKAGVASGNDPNGVGPGGYATAGVNGQSTQVGGTYGNALLIPMVGGSGGGGTEGNPGGGGGAGAGAILIASDVSIELVGGRSIEARGGVGFNAFNGGSGGAIRLVAPVITGSGNLDVRGVSGSGSGRIRVDTLNRGALSLNYSPAGVTSIGSLMTVFPSPLPRLDILRAAGTDIAEGSGPVNILLPFGSSPAQTITIQARDFGAVVPITVVLTPDHGDSASIETSIDNSSANPATLEVPVEIPANVQTAVHVWTR